jgi:hypothetical protein
MTANADVWNGTVATTPSVTTVTFTARYGDIEVQNLEPAGAADTSIIYFTTNGTAPTVGGQECFAVEPGQTLEVGNNSGIWYQQGMAANGFNTPYLPLSGSQYAADGGTTIKLISAGSPECSVSGQG